MTLRQLSKLIGKKVEGNPNIPVHKLKVIKSYGIIEIIKICNKILTNGENFNTVIFQMLVPQPAIKQVVGRIT